MNENENIKKDNAELEQPKQYDFDKNTFVVKPVFKENSTDTLGTVFAPSYDGREIKLHKFSEYG